jgi:hypothetical protein
MYQTLVDEDFHELIESDPVLKNEVLSTIQNYKNNLHRQILTSEIKRFIQNINSEIKNRNPYIIFTTLTLSGSLIYMDKDIIYQYDKDDVIKAHHEFQRDKELIMERAVAFYNRIEESHGKVLSFIRDTLIPLVDQCENPILEVLRPFQILYSIDDSSTRDIVFDVSIKGNTKTGDEVITNLLSLKEKDMHKFNNQSYVKSLIEKSTHGLENFANDLFKKYHSSMDKIVTELGISRYSPKVISDKAYDFKDNSFSISFQLLDLNEEELQKLKKLYKTRDTAKKKIENINPRLYYLFNYFTISDEHITPSIINLNFPNDTFKAIEEVFDAVYSLHHKNLIPNSEYDDLGDKLFIRKKFEKDGFLLYEYTYHVSRIYHKIFYKGNVVTGADKEYFWKKYKRFVC